MRNASALHWTLLVALLGSPGCASAHHSADDHAVHNLVISEDGAWMAAEERPDRGDGNVRVWSTAGDTTFTIERGQNPRISRDSRWVSALQKPTPEDSRTAKPTNERGGQTLVLLDLQDGSRRTFDFVLSYDVAYASTYLIYLQSPETEAGEEEPSKDKVTEPAAKPAAKERTMGTLHLVHLESDGAAAAIENVTQHVTHQTHGMHQTTDHVAYVLHDEETRRDTLYITALGRSGGWGYRGMYEGEKVEGLRWARDPITVGFLDSTETTGNDGKRRVNSALYTWHVTGPNVGGEFTRVNDESEVRYLHDPVISPDGAWMAAEERSHDRSVGNVRVWSTAGDVTFTIERGQNPRISRDSRWVSALQESPPEDSRTAKPTNERAGQTLVLLDLQGGSRRTFDFVLSYDMTYASTYLVYMQSPETTADGATKPAAKPIAGERTTGTLHQVPLNAARLARTLRPYVPGRTYTYENVVEFATHPTSDHFAYVWRDEETGGDTLHIVKWGIRAWYGGENIEDLRWGRDSRSGSTGDPPSDAITLGFIVSTETTGEDGTRRVNSAPYTWHPDTMSSPPSPVEKFTRVDTPR